MQVEPSVKHDAFRCHEGFVHRLDGESSSSAQDARDQI